MRFILDFIPLFFAIDAPGVLPIFVSLSEGMEADRRRQVAARACLAALLVASGFVLLGEATFRVLGVTNDDFRVAGGLLLLVFAIQDLLAGGKPRRYEGSSFAVVPLGMPLIVGPGVLTTSLLLVEHAGGEREALASYAFFFAALLANLAIVYLVLRSSEWITRIVGREVSIAAGKIASLLLATIGVMMIRVGVLRIMAHG